MQHDGLRQTPFIACIRSALDYRSRGALCRVGVLRQIL